MTPAIREINQGFRLDFSVKDVLAKMNHYSNATVEQLTPRRTYLQNRKALVDWLSGVGDCLHISN